MVIDPRILKAKPLQREKITDDTPCARCGFNLRGLAVWTRCPQCALPVPETLGDAPLPPPPGQKADDESIPNVSNDSPFPKSDPLRPRPLLHYQHLSRAAKSRLGLAMTLVAVGATVMAGAMLLAWMMLFVRAQSWWSIDLRTLERVVGVLACVVALPGVGLWIVGQWMLTPMKPPRPTTVEEAVATAGRLDGLMVDKKPNWPWLVRLAPAPWAPALLCAGASAMGEGVESSSGAALMTAGLLLALFAGFTHAITCLHLREVALVMSDELAARRCWESMLVLPAIMIVTALVLAPADLFSARIGMNTSATHGLFGILALIAFIGVGVWPVWRFFAGLWSLASACRASVTDDIVKANTEQAKRAHVQRVFEETEARRRAGEDV